MDVVFLRTVIIDYLKYVDVVLINGVMHTFIMHKIAEPNVFGVLDRQEGPVTREFLERHK
jgi:hypothetical protein